MQVVYLDLRKVSIQQDACGLTHVGPCACLAGEIMSVPGQQGAPSQVRASAGTCVCCPTMMCSVYANSSYSAELLTGQNPCIPLSSIPPGGALLLSRELAPTQNACHELFLRGAL